MKIKIIFFFILNIILLKNFVFAKVEPDSLNLNITLPNKSITYKNIDLQYEAINSFISGSTPIVIHGLNFGVSEIISKTRFGVGIYYLNTNSSQGRFINLSPQIEQQAKGATILNFNKKRVFVGLDQITMYYIMPNFQITLFKTKWFDIALNSAIGFGYSSKKTVDYFSGVEIPLFVKNQLIANSNLFFPSSIGTIINFNIAENVKLTGLAGYRYILQTIGTSENFDGWYYQVGIKVKIISVLKEIKKDLINWKNKNKSLKNIKHKN